MSTTDMGLLTTDLGGPRPHQSLGRCLPGLRVACVAVQRHPVERDSHSASGLNRSRTPSLADVCRSRPSICGCTDEDGRSPIRTTHWPWKLRPTRNRLTKRQCAGRPGTTAPRRQQKELEKSQTASHRTTGPPAISRTERGSASARVPTLCVTNGPSALLVRTPDDVVDRPRRHERRESIDDRRPLTGDPQGIAEAAPSPASRRCRAGDGSAHGVRSGCGRFARRVRIQRPRHRRVPHGGGRVDRWRRLRPHRRNGARGRFVQLRRAGGPGAARRLPGGRGRAVGHRGPAVEHDVQVHRRGGRGPQDRRPRPTRPSCCRPISIERATATRSRSRRR